MEEQAQNQQGVNTEEVATPQEQVQSEQNTQTAQAQDDKELNFERLRKKLDAAEAEIQRRDQLWQQRFQEIEEKLPKQEQPDPWAELDPFDDSFGQKLKEGFSHLIEEVNEKTKEKERNSPEAKLQKAKEQYQDFDEIVNDENLAYLQKNRPAAFAAIYNSPDPIAAAYETLSESAYISKKRNPAPVPQEENTKSSNQPAHPNTMPKSSAMSKMHGYGRLTDEDKTKIWNDYKRRMGRR